MLADSRLTSSQLSDALVRIAQGDRDAFEAFYEATSPQILSLALRVTQRSEIAEEVVNDVYLQVWRRAHRFDPARGKPLAWVTMLCRSRSLDALRRIRAASPSDSVEFDETRGSDSEYSQSLLHAVEERSAVHQALSVLDSSDRLLLELVYFRGYTHTELAAHTGKPLGTVKTRLRRTLSRLKEFLAEAPAGDQS